MKAIFIAGTDTGVGKTVVTGCLARYILEKGSSVITQKWVQTGANKPLDIKLHRRIMGSNISKIKKYRSLISPYIFKNTCSVHLACGLENRRVSLAKLKKSFNALARDFDYVLVEGIGGLLVPFNKKRLLIDIVKDFSLPVLLVAENKLGAINHTLLSLEALKSRKMKILGIIFNNIKEKNKIILKDNPLVIKAVTGEKIFGSLPRIIDHTQLYRIFIPIGKKILNADTHG